MPRGRPEYIEGALDYGERFSPDPSSGRHRYEAGITYEIGGEDGCEFSPRCLDCPLPRCKYDEAWLCRRARVNESHFSRIMSGQLEPAPRTVRRIEAALGLASGALALTPGAVA